MMLIGCLTYSVCKIKSIVAEQAVHFNNRSKRMCCMITLFFTYAAQMIFSAPISFEYEKNNMDQEDYRKLDVITIIQMIVGYMIGSIIELFIIYMMFKMIDQATTSNSLLTKSESQVTETMMKTNSTVRGYDAK